MSLFYTIKCMYATLQASTIANYDETISLFSQCVERLANGLGGLNPCPSVRSSHACTMTKRHNVLSIFLNTWKVDALVFWHRQWLLDDIPCHLKCRPKVTDPLQKRLWQIFAGSASAAKASGKVQLSLIESLPQLCNHHRLFRRPIRHSKYPWITIK